jgi:hypothetical protein
VAALMKETGAALWIEHDIATHAKLPKAPSSSNDSIAYHIERFGKWRALKGRCRE